MSRKYGGTGLGLTISKRLVELMNGEIGVESEAEKGTTFWFTLTFGNPLIRKKESNEQTGSTSDHSFALKILLVEDNPINQRVAMFNLNKLGHQVTTADNGKVAVELFTQEKFDIVLMDIQMPVMDGLEATREIRRMEAEQGISTPVPIIAMTANAIKGDREKYTREGMTGYISKPFKMKELEEILCMAANKGTT